MPRYRLIAGQGVAAETFDAVDDARAIACVRSMAAGMDMPARHAGVRDGFRLERDSCGGDWQFLFLWVPGDLGSEELWWRWR